MARRVILALVLLGSVCAAAACAADDTNCPPGTERCPCHADGRCNDGLTCASELCVASGAGGDAGAAGSNGSSATGGTGGTEATGGSGGVVVPIEPRECRLIECTTNEDCCVDFVPSVACNLYQTDCAAGDQYACEQYNQYCVCPMICQSEECIIPNICRSDLDCYGGFCSFASATGGTGGTGGTLTGGSGGTLTGGGGGVVDVFGRCVDCLTSVDCPVDAQCVNGQCHVPCTRNEQCALFEACVNGECVEVGCQDDRECVLATGDAGAMCVSGECRLPCVSDNDCTGDFELCQGGLCVFVGCETDEQCRIYFGLSYEPGITRAVCDTAE